MTCLARQNFLCKTQLWRRVFQIGDISQSEFHQLHKKKKNILVFSLINTSVRSYCKIK